MRFVTSGLFIFLLVVLGACAGDDAAGPDEVAGVSLEAPSTEPEVEASGAPAEAETAEAETAEAIEPEAEEPATEPEAVEPTDELPVAAVASLAQQAVERDPVVYDGDFATSIVPIFESKCASCHNAGGPGATHWQLSTADDLVQTHQWIASVVQSGFMPPWPAGGESPLFHEDRGLAADQIEAIVAWAGDGAPLDVDPSTPISAPVTQGLTNFDVEIAPDEPYQGSTAQADDYRCLVYDLGLDEPAWLQAYEFVPDQVAVVHHAVGYLIPASKRDRAAALNAEDEAGGWACYGGAGLGRDDLFLGWAPGQQPTIYPEGSGRLVEPGDFVVLQIHYHYDIDAPEDASTFRVDWADADTGLDRIQYQQYLGPAEIPCGVDETGPLCDRTTAIAKARSLYGVEGVLADGINQVCGLSPSAFEPLTDGIATSECTLPVLAYGEIVSIFGHQHEIGKSIKLTLNAGGPDERVLLDIPDWSFDWQLNYEPVESIVIGEGDEILVECSWDRGRRDPDLEPSYVLWADGTNDEMCFAAIATREAAEASSATTTGDLGGGEDIELPAGLSLCMAEAGVIDVPFPSRSQIDLAVDALANCDSNEDLGAALGELLAANFGGLVPESNIACLADSLATTEGTRKLFTFYLSDSTVEERQPIGDLVGECVKLADVVAQFGFPLPEAAQACVNEAGAPMLAQATVDGALPGEQTIFGLLNPCLTAG